MKTFDKNEMAKINPISAWNKKENIFLNPTNLDDEEEEDDEFSE